jgi:S-DNA-T family DNA segregation ATPase FtsK/SpoIIIE
LFFSKKDKKKNSELLGQALIEKKTFDRILREVFFLLLLFSGAYLTLVLASYSPLDQSWSHTAQTQERILNLGGSLGALLSDILIYLLGLSSWWLVFLLFYSINLIYKKIENEDKVRRVLWVNYFGFVLFVLSSAAIEAGHIINLPASFASTQGGLMGDLLNNFLISNIGYIGSLLLLTVLFASGLSLFTGWSWLIICENIGTYFLNFFNFVQRVVINYIDTRAGKKFEQERIKYVENERKKLEDRNPVEIVVPKNNIKESLRVKKEKQTSLFTEIGDEGELPPLHLLDQPSKTTEQQSPETIEFISRLIEKKLLDFGIEAKVISAQPGPVITRYELEPSAGVKGSQVTNLSKDLARSLSVTSVRVVETIPGKTYMGLEIPNTKRQIVFLSEIMSSKTFADTLSLTTIALGKDISGKPIVADLAKMPHVLIAGTTGSGKSVAINALILSLLYKAKANEVKLIMIDPKMLELSVYQDIPHLLTPVVTDMREAGHALNWSVKEMDRRYKLMSEFGVRNVAGFNDKLRSSKKSDKPLTNPFSLDPENPEILDELPLIIIVIDELADLMMVVGKKAEQLIARIAQKARAAGIHLVLATQRPSVDVITGLIKANVPVRIAFQVSSRVDSRTILDQMGAENLLGQGDMLYLPAGTGYPSRVHGAFVSDQEVHKVVSYLKQQGTPNYIEDIINSNEGTDNQIDGELNSSGEKDPLYDQAVQIVLDSKKPSISFVQRNLRIGYNRAARIIEDMERAGLVSPMQSNGNREIIQPNSE